MRQPAADLDFLLGMDIVHHADIDRAGDTRLRHIPHRGELRFAHGRKAKLADERFDERTVVGLARGMFLEGGKLGDDKGQSRIAKGAAIGIYLQLLQMGIEPVVAGVGTALIPDNPLDVHRRQRMDHGVVKRRPGLAGGAQIGAERWHRRAIADAVEVGAEFHLFQKFPEIDRRAAFRLDHLQLLAQPAGAEMVLRTHGDDVAPSGLGREGVVARRGPITAEHLSRPRLANLLAVEKSLVGIVYVIGVEDELFAHPRLGQFKFKTVPRHSRLGKPGHGPASHFRPF